jgi:hypothetical protein
MPRSNSVSGGRRFRRAATAPNSVGSAGPDDQASCGAAPNVRAEEDAVRALAEGRGFGGGSAPFLGREAFARQDRLVDKAVGRIEEDAVPRYQRARRQEDDVARYDGFDRHRRRVALANDGRACLHLRLECGDGGLRRVLP